MGCGASSTQTAGAGSPGKKQQNNLRAAFAKATSGFGAIPDQYSTFEEVSAALRKAGLESSQLVVGVDFTKSNTWTGKRSFQGRCLHSLETGSNPYFEVLTSVANVLKDFDDDNLIPAYGFGDARTKNRAVFSFQPGDAPCDGLGDCLARYAAIAATVDLAGPTNFAPLIRQAIELVRTTGEYHILVMVADGQVDQVKETADAIVEASNYPLSIVMIGVGDGPWDMMEEFDDELPARRFDNFQFVNYDEICRKYPREKRDIAFAVHALMEVPDQYMAVKELGLLQDQEGPIPPKHGRIYQQLPQPLPPPPRSLDGMAAPTLLRNLGGVPSKQGFPAAEIPAGFPQGFPPSQGFPVAQKSQNNNAPTVYSRQPSRPQQQQQPSRNAPTAAQHPRMMPMVVVQQPSGGHCYEPEQEYFASD